MTPIKLYIASTLDGYIAGPDGSLDFLNDIPEVEGLDYGYVDFIAGIDVVVMGRKTYEEVMGFDVEWPYAQCRTIVLSSGDVELNSPNTEVWPILDLASLDRMRSEATKGIWACGGGEVIKSFNALGAIDEMTLTIVPRILGAGTPLFPEGNVATQFEHVSSESFETGLVNLVYRRKA